MTAPIAPPLPIEPVLAPLAAALAARGAAVLQAPPGAGKTTRVPLYLLEKGLTTGRILMLEPRRVAARAAAERLAESLGEAPGRRVGYRMRGESVPGTRIEVVTEGILTRMIQTDPELPGVGCVIFDEFHERGLQADLGLALTLEIRAALRPDLLLVVMSATLDAGPVAELIDAPVLTAEGRAWPVETRWLDAPWNTGPGARLEAAVADLTLRALDETAGGLLVFLPGQAEIARTLARLAPRLPAEVIAQPLHGGLPFARQRAALVPLSRGRKLVLATAIAETSLTIPDVRVVIDAGRARRARFDPGSGMTRLITEKVTRAEAEQRRGRAGRVAPGWCYRLWTRGEEGALAAFPPPEIAAADLTGLALELAAWGASGPEGMGFLTPPPGPALAEARALLVDLGALDARGHITAHGRALARLPLHPRLGHMMIAGAARGAGPLAADLAALLQARDPLRGQGGRAPVDLALRLAALRDPRATEAGHPVTIDRGAIEAIRAEARRLRARLDRPPRAAAPAADRPSRAAAASPASAPEAPGSAPLPSEAPLAPAEVPSAAPRGRTRAAADPAGDARAPDAIPPANPRGRTTFVPEPDHAPRAPAALPAAGARGRAVSASLPSESPRAPEAPPSAGPRGHAGTGADPAEIPFASKAPPSAGPRRRARAAVDLAADRRAPGVIAAAPPSSGAARPAGTGLSPGATLSLAYPDRIGLRRAGPAPRYLLAGGKGACLPESDPLAQAPMIVAADLDGDPREAAIRRALPVTEADIRDLHGESLRRETLCLWSRRDRAVLSRARLMLGALALEDRPWTAAPPERIAAALIAGIRDLGLDILPWTPAARRLAARVDWLRAQGGGDDLPDFTPQGLLDSLDDWLPPFLGGMSRAEDLARLDLRAALDSRLDWSDRQRLDHQAPAEITAPTGTRLPIDYSGAAPGVSVRLQEMFGLTRHPVIGPAQVPLVIELLSPGQRPVQTTADLPGFWQSSYADVRRDLRGRYPRHPWPEDPAQADPTRRAKPRGT